MKGRNQMDKFESLSHTAWDCKYHVIFIPKRRRRTLYGELRKHLGDVFRKLAAQKESQIVEGHLMPDHVHMMIAIPPKYAVSQVIGFIKGKSAIHLARVYGERKRNFVGQHFWARGYFVSTVGRDEAVVREYIKKQEKEDIKAMEDELCLLTYAVLACLKGLKEQGCNGPVTEAIGKIEKHINQKALLKNPLLRY